MIRPLGRAAPAALLVAGLLLTASACGQSADLSTDRPDVTMSPPPDGDHLAQQTAKKKPAHTRGKAHRHASKPRSSSNPMAWHRVRDAKSGVSFLLPTDVDPMVIPLPLPGGQGQQRMYVSEPGDGSMVMADVVDAPGVHSFNLEGSIQGARQALQSEGATQVSVGGRRSFSFEGHDAAEFDLRFSKGAAVGYAIFRLVMLDERYVLAGVASPATGVEAQARRDSRRLEDRLVTGLRFG